MSSSAAMLDTAPNGARTYDILLRGSQDPAPALRPDREMAARIAAAYPPGVPGPRDLAIANRIYLQRAVSQAVHEGSRQVLDLGAGFPRQRMELRGAEPLLPLHEVAKAVNPGARCAYVDRDLLAVTYGVAAVRDIPGVSYAHRDLSDVAAVRACPEVTGTVMEPVIDWEFPVTVVLGLTLHFWPADQARAVIDGYLDGLKPGSRVVVTVASWDDPALFARVQDAFAPARLFNHSATRVMAMLRGTTLLGNGIETARGPAEVVGREVPACVLAGTGLV